MTTNSGLNVDKNDNVKLDPSYFGAGQILSIRITFLKIIALGWESDYNLEDEIKNINPLDKLNEIWQQLGFQFKPPTNCEDYTEQLIQFDKFLNSIDPFANKTISINELNKVLFDFTLTHLLLDHVVQKIGFLFNQTLCERLATLALKASSVVSNSLISFAEGQGNIREIIDQAIEKGLFRSLMELSNPTATNLICSVIGQKNPFANFSNQVIRPTAYYNAFGNNEWIKPETEALYLCIPIPTPERSPIERTTMLSAYYQLFPQFLGSAIKSSDEISAVDLCNKTPIIESANWGVSGRERISPTSIVQALQNINILQDDAYLGLNDDLFLSFGAKFTSLVSCLWENPDLQKALNYPRLLYKSTQLIPKKAKFYDIHSFALHLNQFNSEELQEFNINYNTLIEAVFNKLFDYVPPWIFKIRLVMVPQNVVFNDDLSLRLSNQIINMTTLEIPFAPNQHRNRDVSLALARYNLTGPQYPFTCS